MEDKISKVATYYVQFLNVSCTYGNVSLGKILAANGGRSERAYRIPHEERRTQFEDELAVKRYRGVIHNTSANRVLCGVGIGVRRF